jgi:hypothetical protein
MIYATIERFINKFTYIVIFFIFFMQWGRKTILLHRIPNFLNAPPVSMYIIIIFIIQLIIY